MRKKRQTIYTCNEHFFDNIENEIQAYWLGIMYSDGYIVEMSQKKQKTVNLVLAEEDKAHIELFKKTLGFTGPIYTLRPSPASPPNAQNNCGIHIFSDALAESLIKLGVFPKKTYTVKYPDEKILPRSLERHFIRGLIDGDGCISISNLNNPQKYQRFDLTFTRTREMCEGVLKFWRREDIKLTQRYQEQKEHNINNFSIHLSGRQQIPKLLDEIYTDAKVYLERKYQKYLLMKELNKK